MRPWQLCVTCLAAAYPVYWLANSAVQSLPGVAHWIVQGRPLGLELHTGGVRVDSGMSPWIQWSPGAVAILALSMWLRKRVAWLAGLLAAAVGLIVAAPFLMSILFPRRGAGWLGWVGLGAGSVVMLAGCRWMLRATSAASLSTRCATLAGAVVVPLIGVRLLAGMTFFPRGMRVPPELWLLLAIVGAAALSARAATTSQWRAAPVFAGLLVSPALYWASNIWGGDLLAKRALASLPATDPSAPYQKHFFQRGVSFTAEGGSRYDSERARQMLEQLPAWGVNSIALIPYGFHRTNPIRIGVASRGSWESEDGMAILASMAHERGMRVMLKPHVWRVNREQLKTDDDVRAWFDQYKAFIAHYAKFAARIHADLFCVGVEYGWLTKHEQQWREIIAVARVAYGGPLVYAANHGEEFETVAFWDALDYIGLDNYYPLPDNYSTAALMAKVEAVQKRFVKPVLFTEAGFSAVVNAHRAPWEDETDKELSLEEQAKSYEALLASFYEKDWFHGVYWWKVGTNGYGGPQDNSMTPWRKPAMDVVKRWYTSGKR